MDEFRERRRYIARGPGFESRPRTRRKDALADLADALRRYLRTGPQGPLAGRIGDAADWTAWAAKLGTGNYYGPAPDGSEWYVATRIDYV